LYNSIINKTPIDATTNRRIGGSAPSVYLRRLQNDISRDALYRVLLSHWLNPESLSADRFADCFVERGEAMLDLIGKAMGKPMPSGRETFLNALNSAGIEQAMDEFEDTDESDLIGAWVYQDDAVAAK
jgi:hypothetical protein